jgi:hypothetical protein
VIEECSDLCISVVQARFYGGRGGVFSRAVSSAWGKAAALFGGGGSEASNAINPEEEDSRHEFSSASQFAGDVVAHVMLSALMMTLLLGVFSPAATIVVECIVLLLFLGDEVRHSPACLHVTGGGLDTAVTL